MTGDLFDDRVGRRGGMGAHHSAKAGSHTWLTPLPLLRALGPFGLDPCAYPGHPTAERLICLPDDGLAADWGDDRVWLNPPYGHHAARWLLRLARHGRGTALIFARTETEAFHAHVWRAATALRFLEGRLTFLTPDGKPGAGNAGAPSVLVAYGHGDAEVLGDCSIPGAFVPLRLPRSIVIAALPVDDPTWSDLVGRLLAGRGPLALSDLYRLAAKHPKAGRNPNWQAKIRQVLQQGAGRRVQRGVWAAA